MPAIVLGWLIHEFQGSGLGVSEVAQAARLSGRIFASIVGDFGFVVDNYAPPRSSRIRYLYPFPRR
jgi:hypothetical protein